MQDNRLSLPEKHYGPLCTKIMDEFAQYHKISLVSFDLPCKHDNSVEILSKIMHLMVCTFSDEKKKEIIEEIQRHKKNYEEFFSSVPEKI